MDLLYSGSVKKPSDDKLPALSTKTNVNELTVYMCDENHKYTDSEYKNVRKEMIFLVTIEISGVWFIKSKEQPVKNFGLAWNTKSILLFSTTARPKFNFQLGTQYAPAIISTTDKEKKESTPSSEDTKNDNDPRTNVSSDKEVVPTNSSELDRKRSYPFSPSSESEPPTHRPKVMPGSEVPPEESNPAHQAGFPPV